MIGIYYGHNWILQNSKISNAIQSIDIDAILEEVHDWSSEITLNPVESGFNVSDSIMTKPDKLRISGVITNSPFRGADAGKYFGYVSKEPRTQTAFEKLYELQKNKELVTAYTKHAIYPDMAIQSININRSASNQGEGIHFIMELVNIRIVSTQMVTTPPGISPKKTASKVGKKAEPQKTAGQKMLDENYKTRAQPASLIKITGIKAFQLVKDNAKIMFQ